MNNEIIQGFTSSSSTKVLNMISTSQVNISHAMNGNLYEKSDKKPNNYILQIHRSRQRQAGMSNKKLAYLKILFFSASSGASSTI